jgi:hypothetical protein
MSRNGRCGDMRIATTLIVTAVLAALAVPALAAPHVQPHLILRGTPVGQRTLMNDINANFFLDEKVLGSKVHARIAGHQAKVTHVGGNSAFYVADLPSSVKLHWGRVYRVIIVACDKHGCSTYSKPAKLPKPGL